MQNALILLAGGIGKRAGFKIPKQFIKIGNTSLIEYFISNLDENIFDIIVIASKKENKEKYLKSIKKKNFNQNIKFCLSGKTRQDSVKKSLNFLNRYNPKNVLIHDSARPLASNKLIKNIIKKLSSNLTCIPYIRYHDHLKFNKDINFKNNYILNIQTPQGYNFKKILFAHNKTSKIDSKDDSVLIEDLNIGLKLIPGENTNLKITKKEDMNFFNLVRSKDYRVGIGYDIHKLDFNSNKKLILCGVKINHPPLIGHSDADVGYHAVCDSILGSLSMRDIGYYFKDNNIKWKDANSKIFIKFCYQQLLKKGYTIKNLDINFICEKPNINKFVVLMKVNLSKLLNISTNKISIKATTNEKISFIGRGEGIASESIVQISNE